MGIDNFEEKRRKFEERGKKLEGEVETAKDAIIKSILLCLEGDFCDIVDEDNPKASGCMPLDDGGYVRFNPESRSVSYTTKDGVTALFEVKLD